MHKNQRTEFPKKIKKLEKKSDKNCWFKIGKIANSSEFKTF